MKKQKFLVIGVIIFVVFYLFLLLWRGVENSVFFKSNERINILLYGMEPVVVSMGLTDGVNYIIRFDNSYKTYAPGGYGYYGIGALGKLGVLEKDPDLLRRTFSLMIGAHINYYLYPKNMSVYYDTDFTRGFSPTKSALISALLDRSIKSNVRFLDKIFLFIKILKQRKIDYVRLSGRTFKNDQKENIFDDIGFFKNYQGFFYKKSLRANDASVQIQYRDSYKSAKNLARVMEGEGIKVSDIDIAGVNAESKECLIRYGTNREKELQYQTDNNIRKILQKHCVGEEGNVGNRQVSDSFDIVVVLSPQIEEEWK